MLDNKKRSSLFVAKTGFQHRQTTPTKFYFDHSEEFDEDWATTNAIKRFWQHDILSIDILYIGILSIDILAKKHDLLTFC